MISFALLLLSPVFPLSPAHRNKQIYNKYQVCFLPSAVNCNSNYFIRYLFQLVCTRNSKSLDNSFWYCARLTVFLCYSIKTNQFYIFFTSSPSFSMTFVARVNWKNSAKKNRCQHARETLGVLFVRHTPRVLRGALTFLSFAKYFFNSRDEHRQKEGSACSLSTSLLLWTT